MANQQLHTDHSRQSAIRRAVLDELEWDALIEEATLDVTVDGDVVTLIGTAPSLAQKLAAQHAALTVDGVHDVVNAIDVKVPSAATVGDGRLRAVLHNMLAWDALVPDRTVDVDVHDGWVMLRGEVPTVRQRQEAQRAVTHVVGVRGVTNEILIEPRGLQPDEVRPAVERALTRRAVRMANRIGIVVDEGHVTLSGVVDSSEERLAVLGAVSHVIGVDAVCDELRIARPD